ncbi:2,3-bisphosphoglycerate-independent phosphoglycerate mutase [Chitinispirillales bacterium ANBcel5]|uniref:2,3-bisphosphoglycerate-independent phosphoglycerate mutase n=1 Tax=Cellulosispirillum alkaliphilum TaxID=3039283 RepID=UPI002A5672C7|nr:2,3-bisphosphoglycerate-independent phosphoglycerate mutase [Chitinispirillales bacterium ANBcel5]
MKKRPLCLILRDGWGRGKHDQGDAIFAANTPYTDTYEKENPTTLVETSGLSAGLPEGYQGNSEVGHLNIGAGRTIYQSLTKIDKSVSDGTFYTNSAFLKAIDHAKEKDGALHLIGLIQEEGVHAVTRHCVALLELCKEKGLENVVIHAITDGRDTPPKSAQKHMELLQKGVEKAGVGRVATVIGRYFAMDRDNRWDRTELAYRAIMDGKGTNVSDWREAIDQAYKAGETDEFIKPRVIDYKGLKENDSVIFFNFRFDRTRQLTKSMVEPSFAEFSVDRQVKCFIAMTHYYDNGNFMEAFPEMENKNILGEVLSSSGMKQLRCAETEKYAHVTFFFNGQRNDPFPKEDRILVNSPKVATYDLQPEMSAFEVRDKLVEAIKSNQHDVVICNFANCDMVGHTGIKEAIIKAVETIDTCVHDVVEAALSMGGACILAADHGNAEQIVLEDGSPMTSHTTNPVPLTIVGYGDLKLREGGKLSDIAPTMLEMLGIEKPVEMDGTSILLPGQI